MNRKVRKWICGLLTCMAVSMTPYCIINSLAATARISFSDPSAKVGEEVSVTMKFTSVSGEPLGDTKVMLAYEDTLLEFLGGSENASGGTGAIVVRGGPGAAEVVTTLRFRALQAGSASITVTDWEGYDNDGQLLTMEKEGSSKIAIAGLETSSADATLKSLQISPGVLNPAFTPATENYSTNVGLDTDRLTVSALANNEQATVTVEGGDALVEGENKVVCNVRAEDGTTVKTYTITVNKVADGTGTGENNETTAPTDLEVLAELNVSAKKIQFLSWPANLEIPAEFKERSIAIGDTRLQGWTLGEEEVSDYCIFYGRIDEGEPGFYRYDKTEKTVQKYYQNEMAGALTDEQYQALVDYNDLLDDFKLRLYIIIGLGVLAGILAVALIAVLVSNGKKKDGYRNYDDGHSDIPVRSHGSHAKKMSREERYMMGVEDEFDDAGPASQDAFEGAAPDAYLPEPAKEAPVPVRAAPPVGDVEAVIAARLAREAAAAAEFGGADDAYPDEEDDDFEFFDLDDQ